jgi:hypothetical protein
MEDAAAPARRGSRFWLFAPFAVVGLVIVAWCAAWFVIRNRTEEGLDAWLAREAAAGRQWTCADRSIGGFPSRVEVTCASIILRRGALTATTGRVDAVAQIYRPRHVIVQAAGPLRVEEDGRVVEGRWRQLDASVRTGEEGLRQLSAIMQGADWRVTGATPEPVTANADRLEVHARPSPSRTDESVDLVARASRAAVPLLDTALGSPDPANLELQARASQGLRLGAEPLGPQLERWREAGGALDVVLLTLAKGTGRLEAKGRLGLDAERRVEGRLDASALGLETALRPLLGGDSRASLAAGLLGALGRGTQRPPAEGAPSGLQPLPPLRFEGGRVFFGPIPVPGVRLTPLY